MFSSSPYKRNITEKEKEMRQGYVIMKNDTPVAIVLNPTLSKIKHNMDSIRDEWHNQLKQRGQSTEMAFVHSIEVLVIE